MRDDRALERWFALEMMRFQSSFVPAARPLHELMLEAEPAARTRAGELHRFDLDVLRRIHDALGPLARRRVRLPVSLYVDRDASDEALAQDESAIEVLRALGEVPAMIEPREGKLWIARSRAVAVAQKWPTAFQFVYF